MIKEQHKVIVIEPKNFKTDSCVIKDKRLDGAIFIYDMATNDNDLENTSHEELLEKLSDCFNHDPDGVLVWIPKQYEEKFITFISQFIVKENEKNTLNFDNGSISEAFGFNYVEQGVLVEMIDPECDSSLFYEALNQFYEQENIWEDGNEELDLTQVFSYEGYHLFSSLQTRNEENHKFYDLIKMINN